MNFGPDYVRAIAPYQGGKPISEVAREFGLEEASIVKLASNENPLGIPESAKQAMMAALADLSRYPDSNGFDLKAAISAKFGVPTDWITLGNGSNDILELAAGIITSMSTSKVMPMTPKSRRRWPNCSHRRRFSKCLALIPTHPDFCLFDWPCP